MRKEVQEKHEDEPDVSYETRKRNIEAVFQERIKEINALIEKAFDGDFEKCLSVALAKRKDQGKDKQEAENLSEREEYALVLDGQRRSAEEERKRDQQELEEIFGISE